VDAYPHRHGIFIPFRKDTSSPELEDILKANKSLSKSSTTNSESRALSNTSYPIAGANTPLATSSSSSHPRK
jgi:hypothetical protein